MGENFPTHTPAEADVLPFQLRGLIAYQMQRLADKLSGDDFKVARQEGAEACREQRMQAAAPY